MDFLRLFLIMSSCVFIFKTKIKRKKFVSTFVSWLQENESDKRYEMLFKSQDIHLSNIYFEFISNTMRRSLISFVNVHQV